MTDIFLKLVNGSWKEVSKQDADKDTKGNPFSINAYLKNKLDNLQNLVDSKWDGMFIIDGRERSGKSSLAAACGWYLTKGKMTSNNFASGIQDCARKIATLPDKSVMVMDEGSTMFGSKDSTGKAQKQLIKIMDVVGQKNMIFIVCLPCFFDLNKTIAVRRSLFLIHIKPKELANNWKREPFHYFDMKKKAILYRTGKKNYDSYSHPQPTFNGKYYEFVPPFWEEYENTIKKESLNQVLSDAGGIPSVWDEETLKPATRLKLGRFARYFRDNFDIELAEAFRVSGFSERYAYRLMKLVEDEVQVGKGQTGGTKPIDTQRVSGDINQFKVGTNPTTLNNSEEIKMEATS